MSKELWDMQESFTHKFFATKGGMPKTEKELTDSTKDYLLHLMKEVTEVLDQISFKMHRTPKDFVDRGNVLEEMVDCQKYLWGLMQLWDFSYEDFFEEFRRKSSVVEQRFAQERSMHALRDEKCVLIDIDGVLSDYPRCFYEAVSRSSHFVNSYHYCGDAATAAEWLRELPVDKYEEVKRWYRQSGAKADLPVLAGACEMLTRIRERGVKIVLLTNRPYAEHFRIYPDTLEWLAKNNLPYDAIIWAKDKGFEAVKNFSNVLWAVDDQADNIEKLRAAGIQCIKVDPLDTDADTAVLSVVIQTHPHIEDIAKLWNTKA